MTRSDGPTDSKHPFAAEGQYAYKRTYGESYEKESSDPSYLPLPDPERLRLGGRGGLFPVSYTHLTLPTKA